MLLSDVDQLDAIVVVDPVALNKLKLSAAVVPEVHLTCRSVVASSRVIVQDGGLPITFETLPRNIGWKSSMS